ncbi:hypothetical protein NE237_012969 [Protea cynaroides]|uniref:Neprosin PEP catalytic domain-containing protein n=1 Tax=Protea cynaroides TaxID=273540 RepID=A0A9Q0H034_9MAGN|nr:hypothetical protein NE237_012969 [Protea cynaroides]
MAKVISLACIGLKTIILAWVTICVACKDNVAGERSTSRENYLEAKELVKILNRPKVKSIQVENGDIFDCVIINKQLALEHLSLQNHTIQNDDYNTSGCYNLYCPGFVQVSSKLPLAWAITPISIYGGSQSEMFVSVSKDPKTGNWLLSVNGEFVGYWPKTIYKALSDGGANRADWGGEVCCGYLGNSSFPTMGSGHFPSEGDGKACLVSEIQIITKIGGSFVDFGTVTPFQSAPQCYKILEGTRDNSGRYILYGGPGGRC